MGCFHSKYSAASRYVPGATAYWAIGNSYRTTIGKVQLRSGQRFHIETRKIAAYDHRGGAIVYEAVLHIRRSKQGRRGFHGERFVSQDVSIRDSCEMAC